jgi:general secretion pathway protein I
MKSCHLIKRSSGFTLLEIMIALAILAIGLISFLSAQGNSLRASGRAEYIETASLLARQKMTEKILELKKELEKGGLPEDTKTDQGDFDPPFDAYRWEFTLQKVEIPLPAELGDAVAGATGEEKTDNTPQPAPSSNSDTAQAPESAQRSLLQIVSKKISDSVREVQLKVIWDELGTDQSMVVTTHLVRPQ